MILNIETSLNYCSVAISEKGEILKSKISENSNNHAAELAILIQQIIKETFATIEQMQAIAVSSGPGSYTGLRIGVSTAKGLAYASQKPLIAVNTLEIMINVFLQTLDFSLASNVILCPMIDARRDEVFTCFFNLNGKIISEPTNMIIDEFSFMTPLENTQIVFFGNGSEKCKNIIKHDNAVFVDNISPEARFMAVSAERKLTNKEFEDVAYFEPLYIKPFIATTPKNKLW